jgi:hypothetical protein
MKEIVDFITPLVNEGISMREAARTELGMAPLAKEDPEGPMMAVNVDEVDYPTKDSDGYQDDSGTPVKAPDNIPGRKDHDSSKPPIALHPSPQKLRQHQVNELTEKSENEESKPVGARDFARFANNKMNFVNASNIPLKVTVTQFTSVADTQTAETYIVRVDNG